MGGNFLTRIVRYLRNSLSFFFRGDLGGHWVIFILILSVTLYPMLTKWGTWFGNPLRMGAAAYALAYACTLVGTPIRNKYARNIFYTAIFIFVLSHCIMQIFCINATGGGYSIDLLSAALATNGSEASEFINIYCTTKPIIILCILPLFLMAMVWIGKRLRRLARPKILRAGAILFLAIVGIGSPYKDAFYSHTAVTLAVDLPTVFNTLGTELHPTHPAIKVTSADQPPVVVWIIGESLTNHHCSLYGYEKPTNPLLQKKVENGSAFIFTGVQAAKTYTQQAFQLMMSTYTKSDGDKVKWYNCPTLPDIAKAAGYHTRWISNQSKKGVFDNIVSQYADLCDTCVFIGNKFAGTTRTSIDGELLPVVKTMLAHPSGKDFYIVHLMGCHGEYEMRYPSTFDRFKESEYANRPEHQRYKFATYDNAVLYNDYIVSTIMDMVGDREAVVIYAPDHGEDVYEGNPYIAGHSNIDNPISSKAGHDIPFIIYTTEAYRQRHPDTVQRMKESVSRKFDLEDAPYLMMDFMQCDFVSQPAVKQKSLIRE